jgi:pimeloyl-ACP methyl ester carboxylesterase
MDRPLRVPRGADRAQGVIFMTGFSLHSVPTLVLHRRNDRAVRIAAGRDMASQITGAQYVELDGNDHWFFAGAQQPVLEAIKRFVNALPRNRRPTR